MEKLRKLVSGDKYRFVDPSSGVNLDLTYITPRIIAMGLPGQSVDALWRNDIDDVSKFLHGRHGTKFMIVNLSGEKYDYKKFHGREIRDFYFPDHSPPDLPLLMEILTAIEQYLSQDPDNVVAVHCLAGRSRTGCVIACFLLHSRALTTADEAIRYFNESRSTEGRNIVLPSQVRYVQYYETVVQTGKDPLASKSLQLARVEMSPLPPVQKCKHIGSITPVVEFYSHRAPRSLVFRTAFTRKFRHRDDPNGVVVETENCVLEGDVQMKVYHQARSVNKFTRIIASDAIGTKVALTCAPKFPLVPLCRATFNTSFIDPTSLQLTLTKDQLDAVFAGPLTSSVFPSDFKITLVFETASSRNPMSVINRPLSTPPSPAPVIHLPSAPSSTPSTALPSAPNSVPIPVYTTPTSPSLYLSAQHAPSHLNTSPRHFSTPVLPNPLTNVAPTTNTIPPWVAAKQNDASLVHPSQLLVSPPSHAPQPQFHSPSTHNIPHRISDPGYMSAHSSIGQYISPHASMSQWSTPSALPPVVLPPPPSSLTPSSSATNIYTSASTAGWSTTAPPPPQALPPQTTTAADPLQMSVLSNSNPPSYPPPTY